MPNFFKKGNFFFGKGSRPAVKSSTTSYNYQPRDPLRQAEAQLVRRFSFLFGLIILLFVVLYLWGIPMVAAIGSFWQRFNPNLGDTINNNSDIIVAPRLDPLPSAINDFSKLKITGLAAAGQKVQIVINENVQKEVMADTSGRFEAADLSLITGSNQIYAKTIEGKTESKSSVQEIFFSKTPPKLEVFEPIDGAEITDSSKNWLTISGKTAVNITLTINDHQAILDLDGNFKYQYLLAPGENRLTIKAVDEAGNQSVIERTVKFNPTNPSPTPSG